VTEENECLVGRELDGMFRMLAPVLDLSRVAGVDRVGFEVLHYEISNVRCLQQDRYRVAEYVERNCVYFC
jgi:hypothetical protein